MLTLILLLLHFLLFLIAIEFSLLHLPLPYFGKSGLKDGLPLLLESFSFSSLVCSLKKRTDVKENEALILRLKINLINLIFNGYKYLMMLMVQITLLKKFRYTLNYGESKILLTIVMQIFEICFQKHKEELKT